MASQLMTAGAPVDRQLILEQFALFSRKVTQPPKQRATRKLQADLLALQRFVERKAEYVDAITYGWTSLSDAEKAQLVEVAHGNLVAPSGEIQSSGAGAPEPSLTDVVWWLFKRQWALRTLDQGREALFEISDAILAMHESDQAWFGDLLRERLTEAREVTGGRAHNRSRGETVDGGTRAVQD